MATTSTSALFTRSGVLSNASRTPKRRLAASADSRRLVESAVISKSCGSDFNAGMCACAAQPRSGLAPMMPTRILLPRPVLIDIKTCRSSDIDYFSRLEHLDFECNFDVFAHEQAAGLERDVPGQAPVLAVDGRVRAETGVNAAHWILRLTGVDDVQGDRPRHVSDRQLPCHLVLVVRGALDARALEMDGRKLLDVQEVWRLQVCVATRVVGDQRPG